jgi:hypothetical protein
VTSAASFPDGGAAHPPTSASSAVDDLLGLENEISAIQVKKIIWVKKKDFSIPIQYDSQFVFSVIFFCSI